MQLARALRGIVITNSIRNHQPHSNRFIGARRGQHLHVGMARTFLRHLAADLDRAADARDAGRVLAGLDLVLRAPSAIHNLEVRP